MDGRLLYLSFDEVISPETRKVIEAEGMPIAAASDTVKMQFGNLIVRFNITFPSYIPEEHKQTLVRIFSPTPN